MFLGVFYFMSGSRMDLQGNQVQIMEIPECVSVADHQFHSFHSF